jgi:hypothetical protein
MIIHCIFSDNLGKICVDFSKYTPKFENIWLKCEHFSIKATIYLKFPLPPPTTNNVGSGKVDLQHMSPKYQHCIRGGTKFENLRSLLIFFQDCSCAQAFIYALIGNKLQNYDLFPLRNTVRKLATSRPWGREGVVEGVRDPSDEVASGRLVSLAGI